MSFPKKRTVFYADDKDEISVLEFLREKDINGYFSPAAAARAAGRGCGARFDVWISREDMLVLTLKVPIKKNK
jgi:hypothetical protein